MTYRERFEATVTHKPVDRVPFDLCGTPHTGIDNEQTAKGLRQLLGLSERYDGWYKKFDDRILRHLDIDVRRVGDILEPENPLSRKVSDTEFIDCWGVKRVYTGMYWDIIDPPLKGAASEDLDSYPWPDASRLDMNQIDGFRDQAIKLFNETSYVVCAEHPIFGILELGCWMCGFDDFLLKMALDPDFVIKFFGKVLDYQKKVIEIYYGAIGQYIHFTTSGDDFGTQNGPFVSPKMFAEFIKPYLKERIRHTKKYTNARFFQHTCGSVYSLIPHLIDAGVDILNPIQPGARDMEPERLKEAFGGMLTFYGGIDTQHVLPQGSPENVRAEVCRVLDSMAVNGGFVLAPAHNIQPDVPAENIIALYEAGKMYFSDKNK
jgi:uroporphyrinogen decarboxylase